VEWLAGAEGGEVLIVFDECHRSKNLDPSRLLIDSAAAVTLVRCL
jgi:type I site-specific restriction-modification system R (restriction) subunit